MGLGDFFGSIGGAIGGGLSSIGSGIGSLAGGIFTGIGLGSPPRPPPIQGPIGGGFSLPSSPGARPGGSGRAGGVLREIGSGLGGLALDVGSDLLISQLPFPVISETGAAGGARAPRPRGSRAATGEAGAIVGRGFDPGGRVRQLPGVRQAGFGNLLLPGEAAGGEGGFEQATALGEFLGLPSLGEVGEFLGLGGGGQMPQNVAMPGGALVVGENGGGVTLPSGGFFFGASQSMLTGQVRVTPRKILMMRNPTSGNPVFWHRVVPRQWKLVGQRRRRPC